MNSMARSGIEQLLDLRVAFWEQSGDTYLLMRVVKLCMLPAAAMMREVSAHAEILRTTKKRCGYVQRSEAYELRKLAPTLPSSSCHD